MGQRERVALWGHRPAWRARAIGRGLTAIRMVVAPADEAVSPQMMQVQETPASATRPRRKEEGRALPQHVPRLASLGSNDHENFDSMQDPEPANAAPSPPGRNAANTHARASCGLDVTEGTPHTVGASRSGAYPCCGTHGQRRLPPSWPCRSLLIFVTLSCVPWRRWSPRMTLLTSEATGPALLPTIIWPSREGTGCYWWMGVRLTSRCMN